jgi:hypothetical protein
MMAIRTNLLQRNGISGVAVMETGGVEGRIGRHDVSCCPAILRQFRHLAALS